MARTKEKRSKQGARDKRNEEKTGQDVVMLDAVESAEDIDATSGRTSRFKEATMNSTSSIHAPPDEVLEEMAIDHLIQRYHEDGEAPSTSVREQQAITLHIPAAPLSATNSITPTSAGPIPATPFGRFSRAVASLWNGGFSSLGKRKAGNDIAESKENGKGVAETHGDDKKKAAETAYREAKEQGLLPAPKIFIRPVSPSRKITARASMTALDTSTPTTRVPTLYKSPSKKDFQKQKKLAQRVSSLELKLAEARKQLEFTLSSAPAVKSACLPTPPSTTKSSQQVPSESEVSPIVDAETANSEQKLRKRKAAEEPMQKAKPLATDSDLSLESERESKKQKTSTPSRLKKKASSRLLRRKTNASKEEIVTVVPNGQDVPPIPSIPEGVDGQLAVVKMKDDGYGGLGHEIF